MATYQQNVHNNRTTYSTYNCAPTSSTARLPSVFSGDGYLSSAYLQLPPELLFVPKEELNRGNDKTTNGDQLTMFFQLDN